MVNQLEELVETTGDAATVASNGATILSTIGSFFSLAWSTIWTGGILAAIGWAVYTFSPDSWRQTMDGWFESFKNTDIGADLLSMIGGFMEILGMENPWPNLMRDHAADMTQEEFAAALPEDMRANAALVSALFPLRTALIDAGIVTAGVSGASLTVNQETLAKLLADPNISTDQLTALVQAFSGSQNLTSLKDAAGNPINLPALLQHIAADNANGVPQDRRALINNLLQALPLQPILQQLQGGQIDAAVTALTASTTEAATQRTALVGLLRNPENASMLPENLRPHAAKIADLLEQVGSNPELQAAVSRLAGAGVISQLLPIMSASDPVAALTSNPGLLPHLSDIRAVQAALTPQAPADAGGVGTTQSSVTPGAAGAVDPGLAVAAREATAGITTTGVTQVAEVAGNALGAIANLFVPNQSTVPTRAS